MEKTAIEVKKMDGWKSDTRVFAPSEPLNRFPEIVVACGPGTQVYGSQGDHNSLTLIRQFDKNVGHKRALKAVGYRVVS